MEIHRPNKALGSREITVRARRLPHLLEQANEPDVFIRRLNNDYL